MVCKMLGDFEFRLAPPQRILYCTVVESHAQSTVRVAKELVSLQGVATRRVHQCEVSIYETLSTVSIISIFYHSKW